MKIRYDHGFPDEHLPENWKEADPYFGKMFSLMMRTLSAGGSELGLGLTLFSLVTSIRAERIAEIGRYKGFSTLSLASALRFLDRGWQEPQFNKQRPDMNYSRFEAQAPRKLYSIDPYPMEEAENIIREAELQPYVEFVNKRSGDTTFENGFFDFVFIDGDHTYAGCKSDVIQYLPYLRKGGYFVLHDYYGWYDQQKNNNSPIKKVVEEILSGEPVEHILMDTGYQSFVIFRKTGT
jgi:hypothetical protein